jgi:integrase
MERVMNAYPFSIFKRADRPFYMVSFKDNNGKFLSPISTKKKTEDEAFKIAYQWLRDGVPKKDKTVTVQDLSLINAARRITGSEAEIVINELKRNGLVKSCIFNGSTQAVDFISFLKNFWDWETSPYINEKLRKSHGIHKMHCRKQGQAISLFWEEFFKGRLLGEITADDIDAFITFMGTKELSASRRNVVIKAGTKPLRWIFAKGKISVDPTRGHVMYTGEAKKRNILTPAIASAIFKNEWIDEMAKIANMLSAITGMRNGEIIGLKYKDIGKDCLYVNNAWNGADKDKRPKNNEVRTVEITFPYLIDALCYLAEKNPFGVTPDSYVFWSTKSNKAPNRGRYFVTGLRNALVQIGFSKEEAKQYDFHGWRHFYTSYMVKKLEKKLVKSQTGHLTDIMIDHYSDHETVGDRELIKAKQREVFADLIPDLPKPVLQTQPVLLLEYKPQLKAA